MTPISRLPRLHALGKERAPAEVTELLASVAAGVSTMHDIVGLREALTGFGDGLQELCGLTLAEASTALRSRRHALGALA